MPRRGLMTLTLLCVVALASSQDVVCPIHGDEGVFTGKHRVVDGIIVYQYYCVWRHYFWSAV